jgi:hypothetical protein
MKVLTHDEILRTLRRNSTREDFDPLNNEQDSNVIKQAFDVEVNWIGHQVVAQIGRVDDLNSVFTSYVTDASEHTRVSDDENDPETAEDRARRFAIAHCAARALWLRERGQRG